ncbi:MAG: hypothetical protein WC156_15895 [Pedobacter sp.]
MTSSANFATIKPLLLNYSAQDLTDFQTSVTNGNTLILPENGKIALQSWSGKGYIDFNTSGTSQHYSMIIGGGYNGGYGAYPAPVAIAPMYAQVNLNISPPAITPRIPSSVKTLLVRGTTRTTTARITPLRRPTREATLPVISLTATIT